MAPTRDAISKCKKILKGGNTMPYVLCILEVKDFADWKSAYDIEEGAAIRKTANMKSYQIFQCEDDPNKIVHLSQWDNMDDAHKFLQSEELKKANQQSGVTGMSDIYYIEEVESKSV
jgi:quinol monooxygenase YgiN